MKFYGSAKTVAMLTRFIDRQELPQSVLFTGSTGVGKTTLALYLSKYLLCKQRTNGNVCENCTSCTRINANEHPEVAIVEPDGDITKIWQLWTRSGHPTGALESLSYRPVLGAWRIVIICAAHTLNEEAANSILKVLEEPPAYVQFFLCTTSQSAVLPTIASRCFSVPVPLVPTTTVAEMLTKNYGLTSDTANELAKLASGCPGKAIRSIDDSDVTGMRDRATMWVSDFLSGSRLNIYGQAEALRNLVTKSASETTARSSIAKSLHAVADAFGQRVLDSSSNTAALLTCVDLTMQAAQTVQRNGNPQIVTEALVAKLSRECH